MTALRSFLSVLLALWCLIEVVFGCSCEKRPPKVAYCNAQWLSRVKVLSKKSLNYTEAAYPMFTVYGVEHVNFFKVNYLAHFLLCTRLLGSLKGNQPSRVVVVSSVLHSWHSLDWDDVMAERKYDKYLQYSRSKLMCHLFALALHRRLMLDGCDYAVTVNVLEPGVIDTKLTRAGGKILAGANSAPANSATASTAPVFLAQSAQVDRISGKYFDSRCRQIRHPSADSTDERLQDRLSAYSHSLCQQLLAASAHSPC